jgi:hypothetical protein
MNNPRTRSFFSTITTLAWALWLGAIIVLFIFVQVLFARDRALAAKVAPQLFITFERYQLFLAATALTATALWRLSSPRAIITGIFTVLCIATLAGLVPAMRLTPQMEKLREQGLSSSPEFMALHGKSMIFYSTEALALLLTGLILPAALRGESRQTDPATAAASAPPAETADQSPAS